VSLRRYTTRSLLQRPGRTILTLLSIVIGVSAAVWIDISAATTKATYRQMFAAVTGKTTLELRAAGGAAFDENLLDAVRAVPGVKTAAPVVESLRTLQVGEKQVRLQVMGIDPASDSGVRDYEVVAGRQVASGDEVVLDEEFARPLGVKLGDEVGIRTNRLTKPFEVVGLLKPKGADVLRQASLAFIPIERAQYHFYRRGQTEKYDRIQVVTEADDAAIAKVQAAIIAALPQDQHLKVERPTASSPLMEHTLKSSEVGLELASLFALLLASFIILNTFLMNVSERRRQLAIMRAIGATRWQLGWALLGESLLLGVVGTLIGMAWGLAVAWFSNRILTEALEVNLATVRDTLTWKPFAVGAAFGLVMSVLGALIPAYLVTRVSPLEGMSRVSSGDLRNWSWPFFIIGLLLLAGGALLIAGGVLQYLPITMPMYGGLMCMGGIVALQTVLLRPQATLIASLFAPFRPVEASLALKQVLRHNTRSALTVGVLFIAGATGIGIANSILDNVRDVHEWADATLVGDYYVRAMMPDMATGTAPDLPAELGEELEKVPHVGQVEGVSYIQTTVQAKDETGEPQDLTAICIARKYVEETAPSFDLIEGELPLLREQLFEGQVVIGSVLAQRLGAHVGDQLLMETKQGPESIRIAGIANEYLVGGLSVHMQRRWAEERLAIEGFDAFILRADDKRHLMTIKPQLEAIAAKYEVILKSDAEISQTVDQIVGGIEWGLWVLALAGFVVAAFGVVNTLSMNVLEQTRELGLLRIVAMTKAQVRRTIVTQALIIGGVGLPPGIAAGVLNAYIMNLSMMDTIGHPIEFHLYPGLLALTLGGSLLIVLVAAIIPALRATRINVVEALHYE
jgi:putative ABC transport system permease protein